MIWCQLTFNLNVLCNHCLHDLRLYIQEIFRKCLLIENGKLLKMRLLVIFLNTFTKNCDTTGILNVPIEYTF